MMWSHNILVPCEDCGETFNDPEEYIRHLYYKHSPARPVAPPLPPPATPTQPPPLPPVAPPTLPPQGNTNYSTRPALLSQLPRLPPPVPVGGTGPLLPHPTMMTGPPPSPGSIMPNFTQPPPPAIMNPAMMMPPYMVQNPVFRR